MFLIKHQNDLIHVKHIFTIEHLRSEKEKYVIVSMTSPHINQMILLCVFAPAGTSSH